MLKHFTLSIAALSTAAVAQSTATYTQFGQGCNGSRESTCITQNDNMPMLVGNPLPNEYAHAVLNSTGNTITVIGFSLYTSANPTATTIPATVQTGIYRDSSGAGATSHTTPDLVAVGNGTITVDANPGWYRTTIYPAIIVAPGEAFWIAADTNDALPPDNSAGAPGPALSHWRRPPFGGGSWSPTGLVNNPVFRIHCMGDTEVPLLSSASTPQLGMPFQVDLQTAPTAVGAFFVLAFDNTMWLGMPTPVDLTFFNMPGCFAYSSNDNAFLSGVNNGQSSYTLNIPMSTNFTGFQFWNQWAVIDPTAGNPAGLIVSNAGEGTIG